jgi:uncharacterized protein YraI
MIRTRFIITGLALVLILTMVSTPGAAQGGPDAWPLYNLNMRTGPDTSYAVITKLPARTGLLLEARNGNTSWVLAHTEDGVYRGWVAALYLGFRDGLSAVMLPVSEEVLAAPPPVAANPPPAPSDTGTTVTSYTLPPSVYAIDLYSYPVVGQPTARASSIYALGRSLGNNPHALAKVGDCGTDHPYFLSPFYTGPYDLGNYGYLQSVIDYFGESLSYTSQAARSGFVADAVVNPLWANPAICQPGESTLQCEYRLHKPSVAVIMFGLTDLQRRTPDQFYSDLRAVVEQSIDAGVIPVLSTFPGHVAFPAESVLFNQIVVQVALDYDVPLMNLWLALDTAPDHGMMPDGTHMSGYEVGGACFLVDQNMQSGYVVRNLVTLQTLDAVWRGAMN